MKPRRFEIELPAAILSFLPSDDDIVRTRLIRLLLVDLVRQGIISFGRAAELAGVDKMAFIVEMGHLGIPYYDEDISEILCDAETVRQTMAGTTQ